MLFTTVHLPTAYSTMPREEEGTDNYCSAVITVLEEALSNCVILTDEEGAIASGLELAADKWPVKWAPRLRALLKELRGLDRLVPVRSHEAPVGGAGDTVCQVALRIASTAGPDAVIVPNQCQCDGICQGVRRGVQVGEYKLGSFNEKRRRGESVVLDDGDWSARDFEKAVLMPVLRYAKHVALIDGHIGLATTKGTGAVPTIPNNYRDTLEWIYRLFRDISDESRPRTFEIYCGVDDRTEASRTLDSVEALRTFARMTGSESLPIQVHVKLNTASRRFPHDRFLVTNQTALQIGRGFDLLNRNGRIRSTVVQRAEEEGRRVLADVRAQDDASPANLRAGSAARLSRIPSRRK